MVTAVANDPSLSLYQLLDPAVLADPYPLYRRLRERDPVHWDPFLHTWVATRYADVVTVLHNFSADRTPTPEQMKTMGLGSIAPIAQVMVKQMLFMDAPAHTRLRKLCSTAFTPRRVDAMAARIQGIADRLIDPFIARGGMDVVGDFANPFPAIVAAELLGVPETDHRQLKAWSADFAELLGNFQHNPDRAGRALRTVEDMCAYFRSAMHELRRTPRDGLLLSLMEAGVEGSRLTDDEVIANAIVTMVGGQETTTNLIGNGLFTLLRQPERLAELRDDPGLLEAGVEELLRFESPSQHTARRAPADVTLGGKLIHKGEPVMAVMAAGNRDPERFRDPDQLDLRRPDNRHLAFGWAAHFCFGAPLARLEGRIAFSTLLRRLPGLALTADRVVWRENHGLRGLKALPVTFRPSVGATLDLGRRGTGDGR
jgi:pimeloyl-[acyl-carrier protein] synthase